MEATYTERTETPDADDVAFLDTDILDTWRRWNQMTSEKLDVPQAIGRDLQW
jgi:hypothetical protein